MDNKIIVKIENYGCANSSMDQYYAHMPQFKGLGESGGSAKEAFDELMISLRVKIMYENGLEF